MALLGGMAFCFDIIPPLSTRTTYTYYGRSQIVASAMIPRIYNHSYRLSWPRPFVRTQSDPVP